MSSQNIEVQKLLSMPLDDIVKMNNDNQKQKQQFSYNNKQHPNYSQHKFYRKGMHNRQYASNNKPFSKFGNYQNQPYRNNDNQKKTTSSRLLITNLQKEVVDNELEQIFSRIGKLKRCGVHVDENGKSLGSADVEYVFPDDAKKAMEFFKKTEINGVFMKIEYNLDSSSGGFKNRRRIGKFRKVFRKKPFFSKKN